jgi:hypothetical protein
MERTEEYGDDFEAAWKIEHRTSRLEIRLTRDS